MIHSVMFYLLANYVSLQERALKRVDTIVQKCVAYLGPESIIAHLTRDSCPSFQVGEWVRWSLSDLVEGGGGITGT